MNDTNPISYNRAVRAEEAGKFLGKLVGLDRPIPAAIMWRLAREGVIPTVRLGRSVYFRTVDLEEFVTRGGAVLCQSGGAK